MATLGFYLYLVELQKAEKPILAIVLSLDIEIVVGIDFGTSYSAYTYSYAYDQNKIFMNSDWPSGF